LKNRAFLLLTLGLLLGFNLAWAGPLKLLAELGDLARNIFYELHEEEIARHFKDKEIEKLLEACERLPEKITFELREHLGEGGLEVDFFSLNYVDVANAPPPSVRESIISMREQHEMEGKFLPRILIQDKGQKHVYAFVVPLVSKKNCLLCHGKDAPYASKIKNLYPERRPSREREGDLRGVLVIYVSPEVLEKAGTLKAGL